MVKLERKSISMIIAIILMFSIIVILIEVDDNSNITPVDFITNRRSNRELLSSDIQITDGQPIKTYNGIVPLTKCPAGIFQIYSIF